MSHGTIEHVRSSRRIRTRDLVCNGNVETFALAIGRDSTIRWHFRSWRGKRERMRSWHADASLPPVVLHRRPRNADDLLKVLRAPG